MSASTAMSVNVAGEEEAGHRPILWALLSIALALVLAHALGVALEVVRADVVDGGEPGGGRQRVAAERRERQCGDRAHDLRPGDEAGERGEASRTDVGKAQRRLVANGRNM